MQPDGAAIVEQLSLIGEAYSASVRYGEPSEADARRIVTRCRAAIDRYAPPESAYRDEAADVLEERDNALTWHAEQLAAVVQALRDDYQAGAMRSVSELVHADVFDDLLEMAEELLKKGYIGAAAIVGGAVLEEQLHKLAAKKSIGLRDAKDRPKTVEALGVDLRKAEALSEVERKTVTAWYAQRSEAAHGHFDALARGDVQRLIDGVRDFVARHPA